MKIISGIPKIGLMQLKLEKSQIIKNQKQKYEDDVDKVLEKPIATKNEWEEAEDRNQALE